MIKLAMRHISSHKIESDLEINFFEWLFLRQCLVAFNFANNGESLGSKPAILKIAKKVIGENTYFSTHFDNNLFEALDFLNEKAHYSFNEVL